MIHKIILTNKNIVIVITKQNNVTNIKSLKKRTRMMKQWEILQLLRAIE